MAYDLEENNAINNLVISGTEYLEAINGENYDYTEEERAEADAKYDPGFVTGQKRALALFKKVIAQVHLIPRNRRDYLDLKTQMGLEDGTNIYHTEPMNYQEMFRNALAEQIKFMHDNEASFDNGYLNAMVGFGVGSYRQGGMQMYQMNKLFKGLCPAAYDYLEQMGGMNMCLNHPVRHEDFYKGEH